MKFISEEQRKELKRILQQIQSMQKDMTYEHEEYFLLRSIEHDLKSAINCKNE